MSYSQAWKWYEEAMDKAERYDELYSEIFDEKSEDLSNFLIDSAIMIAPIAKKLGLNVPDVQDINSVDNLNNAIALIKIYDDYVEENTCKENPLDFSSEITYKNGLENEYKYICKYQAMSEWAWDIVERGFDKLVERITEEEIKEREESKDW